VEAVAYNCQEIAHYSCHNTYCKLLLESCILKGILILTGLCVMVTSIQNPIQCEIAHNPAAIAQPEHDVHGMVIQHLHHRSQGKLVTTGKLPGTSIGGIILRHAKHLYILLRVC
jgi:hypothetical protein